MDAGRAPKRIIAAHCPDQIADVRRDRRPADMTARLQAPVETEAARCQRTSVSGWRMVAASSRDGKSRYSQTKISRSTFRNLSLAWSGPLQDDQLLAEERPLGFASGV
jgi:hypothetical protein